MSALEIRDLSVALPNGVPLLSHVSLDLAPGEVRALVGESGAGKSMIGKAILGILPAAIRVTAGRISLGGTDLGTLSDARRRAAVARNAALIPQDPLTALNPVRRIEAQALDSLVRVHRLPRQEARDRLLALFQRVRLRDPERVLRSYPHELSGGMRQRVLIAAAFAARVPLIVADEPTTALDVTVQREILRIIRSLQEETGTSVLFVTHDMGVVAQISQRVSVLFGGRVIEDAATSSVFSDRPSHPYTQALIRATPDWQREMDAFTPVPPAIIAALKEGRSP